jgi:NAD(P)-dependent dehydrogenase (short-subunit alcohol dehydrogenase family)
MLLENRVAIVSGIGPGMGRDISLAFAREGADLVVAARTREKVEALAKEVEALGRRCIPLPADITQDADCAALAQAAVGEFGRIDVLVNNAFHGGNFRTFEDSEVDAYLTPFKVNTLGSLRLTKAVLPTMKAQQSGSVVMINSMVVREVNPGQSTYGASKGALLLATQGLARELGPYGIRVNSVLPGYIWGPNVQLGFKLEAARRGITEQQAYDEIAAQIPLGKIPDSEEISGAVVFFASDLSRVVTGQTLDVNGGHYMA